MDIKAILQYTLETMIRGWMYGKSGIEQHIYSWGLGIVDKWVKEFNSGLEIGSQDFSPLGSVFYWDKIYKSIKNINQELAISSNLGDNIEASFKGALVSATDIGVTFGELAAAYGDFSKVYGRVSEFSSQELVKLAEFREVFKQGGEEMFAAYKITGLSIDRASIFMQKLVKDSSKIGVIAKNVTEELKKNISALDKYSFKNGIAGLQAMAKYAEKTKISMSEALGFTDKLLGEGLEGVVEFGANMQIIGGQFASVFGDFNQLMYDLRNQPEVFQEKLQQAAKTAVELNKTTGELQINPLNMSVLREMSKYSGITLENLSKSGKMGFTQDAVDALLNSSLKAKSNYQDILSVFAGAAQFEEGTGRVFVQMGEMRKYINDLNEADYERLQYVSPTTSDADVYKTLIKSNESLTETLQRLIDQIKLRMIGDGGYQKMDVFAKKGANDIDGMIAASPALQSFMKRFSELSDATVSHFLEQIKQFGAVDGGIFNSVQSAISSFADLMVTMGSAVQGIFNLLLNVLPAIKTGIEGINWGIQKINDALTAFGLSTSNSPFSGEDANKNRSWRGNYQSKTNFEFEIENAKTLLETIQESGMASIEKLKSASNLEYFQKRAKGEYTSDVLPSDIIEQIRRDAWAIMEKDMVSLSEAMTKLKQTTTYTDNQLNTVEGALLAEMSYTNISKLYEDLEKELAIMTNDLSLANVLGKTQEEIYQKAMEEKIIPLLNKNANVIADFNYLDEVLKRINPNWAGNREQTNSMGYTDKNVGKIEVQIYGKGKDEYGFSNEETRLKFEKELQDKIADLYNKYMQMEANLKNNKYTTGGN